MVRLGDSVVCLSDEALVKPGPMQTTKGTKDREDEHRYFNPVPQTTRDTEIVVVPRNPLCSFVSFVVNALVLDRRKLQRHYGLVVADLRARTESQHILDAAFHQLPRLFLCAPMQELRQPLRAIFRAVDP